MRIALDTNILIYFLEDLEPYASKVGNLLNSFMKGENEGVISTINVAEILTGFYAAGDERGAVKAKALLKDLTINGFEIAPVTFDISDLAAKLRAERGGRLPDALIVATAVNRGAEVLLSNDEGLQRFGKYIEVSKLE